MRLKEWRLRILTSELFYGCGNRTDVFSPEVTVKEDVKFLRDTSFFKGTQIVGLLQDTQTGLLREVLVE